MKLLRSLKIILVLALSLAPFSGSWAQTSTDLEAARPQVSEKDLKKERLKQLTPDQRLETISRARIFDPKVTKIHEGGKEAVGEINLIEGLQETCGANFEFKNDPLSPNLGWPSVSCTYHQAEKVLGGSTNKFLCDFKEVNKKGEEKIKTRKVKYLAFSGVKNSELVPTLMAGTLARLIGFHSDLYCPAKIKCDHCPFLPYELGGGRGKPSKSTHSFKDSMVEFGSDLMNVTPNTPRSHARRPHGVSFREAQNISADLSSAAAREIAIEREAWILWLNFLVEMDPQDPNQRIACDKAKLVGDDGVYCDKAYMYTVDYGQSFFRRFQFEKWARTPVLVQEQDGTCSGGMTFQIFKNERGSKVKELYMEPKISLEAKELLLARLMNVSDQQWIDLLRIANTDRLFDVKPETFLVAVKRKIADMARVSCAKFDSGLSVMAKPVAATRE